LGDQIWWGPPRFLNKPKIVLKKKESWKKRGRGKLGKNFYPITYKDEKNQVSRFDPGENPIPIRRVSLLS